MSLQIIKHTDNKKNTIIKSANNTLQISELFTNTIQGEGISIGQPATFLRLQGCVLNCKWCDTLDVWKNGNIFTFDEIFYLFEKNNIIKLLKDNQHLIITGGSPLKQQKELLYFIKEFKKKYNFLPFIEIENECVLKIEEELIPFISQWNNSPKLNNSEMKKSIRYKPEIILQFKKIPNSWFKFVINNINDWQEIETDFIKTNLINKKQIILMPLASSKKELNKSRKKILQIAINNNVKFSDRLHITIFDKKTGV